MRRRFSAKAERTALNFYNLMKHINATSLHIEQDVMSGEAKVTFDRNGRRYVVEGKHFERVDDNLRACYHTIRILHKALTGLGTITDEQVLNETFEKVFGGFLATPEDSSLLLSDGRAPWWETLGVEKDASAEAIRNAFRALSKVHHPDAGGNAEDFKRLRRAYDEGMAEQKLAAYSK